MRTVTQNLIVTFLSLTSPLLAQDADGVAFFESKIRPVLIEHCYNCHGADASEMKGGLRVDSASGLLKGGESGTALVAGKPGESLLIEALKYESYEMPPAGKLPDHVIRDFEKWIQMGAPDPRSEEPQATNTTTEEIDFDKAREFWAYQPMESRSLPKVIDAEWAKSWIDLFTLSKLEEANIAPNPDAELEVLVRRLAYDLTGLPPTPKQVLDVLGGKTAGRLCR